MNSDDALQESNEDRDTFADESEHCAAFYNVDPATHAHTHTCMFVNATEVLVSGLGSSSHRGKASHVKIKTDKIVTKQKSCNSC